MKTHADVRQAAALKQRRSAVLSDAYSATLSALAPANFVLVVGAALLALIAGAAILVDNGFLSKSQTGVLALISRLSGGACDYDGAPNQSAFQLETRGHAIADIK